MSQRKKAKIGNQGERIITVASRLMRQKGYKGASLQEIADLVGIHKSTLFHYFKNKEELLLAVLRTGIDEATQRLRPIVEDRNLCPEEKLKLAVTNHIIQLSRHIDNVHVFLNEIRYLSKRRKREYLEKRKQYELLLKQIIDEIKNSDRGYFKEMDSKLVTLGILGMCNWVSKWYRSDGSFTPEDISKVFYRMITQKSGS